jgi:hypothetical protein
MWAPVAVAVAAALVAAGCGEANHVAACGSLGGASRAAQTGGHASGTMFLTKLRAARGRCVDRVSFIFRSDRRERPGYTVTYRPAREAQTQDGSGRRIKVAGKAFLVVVLRPAATAETNADQLNLTYKGSRRIAPSGMRYVREVVNTGDFEGVVTWAIGLSERRPFRVSTSTRPGLTVEIG